MKKIYLVVEPNDTIKNKLNKIPRKPKTHTPINEVLNDPMRFNSFCIFEKLNTRNTLDYIPIFNEAWLIDAGKTKDTRHLFIVMLTRSNELMFKYVLPPKEYNDVFISDKFDIKLLDDVVVDIFRKKGDDILDYYTTFKQTNLNIGTDIIRMLFNTIYKIILDDLEINHRKLIFFKSDVTEQSRTKLYDLLFRQISESNKITPIASFTTQDTEVIDSARKQMGFLFGMFVNYMDDGYKHYLLKIN